MLILKDSDGNPYMPPDDLHSIYTLLGLMLDDGRIQTVLGKKVYILSSDIFTILTEPVTDYAWIDPCRDAYPFNDHSLIINICRKMKEIYK